MLGDWIENGDRFQSHVLPLNTAIGEAIKRRTTVSRAEIPRSAIHEDFFRKYRIRSFVSVPIPFSGSEYRTLNLYKTTGGEYSLRIRTLAEELVKALPVVYQRLRERSLLDTAEKLNETIREYESHAQRAQLQTARAALDKIAIVISQELRCLETSIFLVPESDPKRVHLQATTFPKYARKSTYVAGEPNPSGWILHQRKPVSIFDLRHFDRDRAEIQSRFPGLEWTTNDAADITKDDLIEITKTELDVPESDQLPPISYMGVPVVVGSELLGMIRCCTPVKPPYYYNDRDSRLLELVASQVGHYWANWLQFASLDNQGALMGDFGQVVRGPNQRRAGKSSNRNRCDESGLGIARDLIPDAALLDIRLKTENGAALKFRTLEPKSSAVPGVLFPLKEQSLGSEAFDSNRTLLDAGR